MKLNRKNRHIQPPWLWERSWRFGVQFEYSGVRIIRQHRKGRNFIILFLKIFVDVWYRFSGWKHYWYDGKRWDYAEEYFNWLAKEKLGGTIGQDWNLICTLDYYVWVDGCYTQGRWYLAVWDGKVRENEMGICDEEGSGVGRTGWGLE